MTLRACALAPCLLLALPGALAAADFDACALLTGPEIEAVQGEPVADAKASSRTAGGLLSAGCYYSLPTHTRSISLQVTLRDPSAESPASPLEVWRQAFDAAGEERDSEPPLPVAGLGDAAFWTADRVIGVLYVLKGDAFFRISLGADEAEPERREKSTRLARQALARL